MPVEVHANGKRLDNINVTDFAPAGEQVLCESAVRPDMSPGGVLFPETAKDIPQAGRIIAVGPGKWDEKEGRRLSIDPHVRLGRMCKFSKYSGTELEFLGTDQLKYILIPASAIQGYKNDED